MTIDVRQPNKTVTFTRDYEGKIVEASTEDTEPVVVNIDVRA